MNINPYLTSNSSSVNSADEDFFDQEVDEKPKTVAHPTHHMKVLSQEMIYKYASPPRPLPQCTYFEFECTRYGNDRLTLLSLPTFIQSEKEIEPLGHENISVTKSIFPFSNIPQYLHNTKVQRQIVYERTYPNSIRQVERETYFFTEIYNLREYQSEDDFNRVRILSQNMRKEGRYESIEPYYKLTSPKDNTLIFESRFESGNLSMAIKISDNEYNLFLQNDINSKGYTQWFFFSVGNTSSGERVKINILNFAKKDSLYNKGMKILVYSTLQAQNEGIGWHRDCCDIKYFINGLKKDIGGKALYTLSFAYDFKYSNDTIYFAYAFPYTFTDLSKFLLSIEQNDKKSKICTRRLLCRTLAGNRCEYLTITSRDSQFPKQGVFLSARVHPGETVGSWMMQGAMEFLTDENDEMAQLLRKHFVFKIVPMLNPDGVINGNYRCGLAGCDLNRRWKKPARLLHPTIYYTKALIKQFNSERKLKLFCDMHGHSKNKNIFMYGCHDENDPKSTRMFPFILSEMCKLFSYKSSKFGVQKSKESTARIALWRDLCIPAIYTIEASFCGSDSVEYFDKHFTTDHLKEMGKFICLSLIPYCKLNVQPQPPISAANLTQTEEEAKKEDANIVKTIEKCMDTETIKNKIDSGDMVKEEDSSGSDDNPSDDNLDLPIIQAFLPTKARRSQIKCSNINSIYGQKENSNDSHSKKLSVLSFDKKPVKKYFTSTVSPTTSKNTKAFNDMMLKTQEPKKMQTELSIAQDDSSLGNTLKKKLNDGVEYRVGNHVATQTEPIDFQRARMKMLMSKYGMAKNKKDKDKEKTEPIIFEPILPSQDALASETAYGNSKKQNVFNLKTPTYSSKPTISPRATDNNKLFNAYQISNPSSQGPANTIKHNSSQKISHINTKQNMLSSNHIRVQSSKGDRGQVIKMQSMDLDISSSNENNGNKKPIASNALGRNLKSRKFQRVKLLKNENPEKQKH